MLFKWSTNIKLVEHRVEIFYYIKQFCLSILQCVQTLEARKYWLTQAYLQCFNIGLRVLVVAMLG